MSLASRSAIIAETESETPRNRPTASPSSPEPTICAAGRRQRRHPPVPNSRNLRRRWPRRTHLTPHTRLHWGRHRGIRAHCARDPQLHRMAASPGGYICTEAELAPVPASEKNRRVRSFFPRFWLKWWDNTNFLSRKLRKKRQQASWGAESRKADRGPLSLTTRLQRYNLFGWTPPAVRRVAAARAFSVAACDWSQPLAPFLPLAWLSSTPSRRGVPFLAQGFGCNSFCRWSPLQSSQVIHSQLNTQPVTRTCSASGFTGTPT